MVVKKKKQLRAPLTGNVKTVKYRCPNCTATPYKRHMDPGDVVVLMAFNTDVTIRFTAGSPFVSGAITINIAEGDAPSEVVADVRDTFPYSLSCSKCTKGTGADTPPEMIVP